MKSEKTIPILYSTDVAKLADLVLNNDLDFAHSKSFSKRFYVLTEDKKRLCDLLQFTDLDPLTTFPDMELELQENKCLFRSSRKPVSTEEAREFCALAKLLTKTFS